MSPKVGRRLKAVTKGHRQSSINPKGLVTKTLAQEKKEKLRD
jgi:hypothetical protein